MAENLPEPESRKELYLAKAAGEDVAVPEPQSREELFLNAIAESGSGGTSDFNDLENRPSYGGEVMDGNTDIPSVTEAVAESLGKAKELTTDDYNWPVDNPTGVALWLLPNGVYHVANSIKYYYSRDNSDNVSSTFIIGDDDNGDRVRIIATRPTTGVFYRTTTKSTGVTYINGDQTLLSSANIADNLTTNYSDRVLDARQGKVLNDKIGGDLASLETEDKTSLINAINELAGGSGGIKTLTSADYDYPTDNPTQVAMWNLEPGFYTVGENIGFQANTSESNRTLYKDSSLLIMKDAYRNITGFFWTLSGDNGRLSIAKAASNGSQAMTTATLLDTGRTVDGLTSTSATYPLSANQGKVLKDMIDALPTGSLTELTEADYNFPTSNPDRIVLSNLPEGLYHWNSDSALNIGAYIHSATSLTPSGWAFVMKSSLTSGSASTKPAILCDIGGSGSGLTYWRGDYQYYSAVYLDAPVNNLTSSSNVRALAATQGKVLNEKIESRVITGAGAPTTTTVGTVGKLYEDTTNGKLYICTAVDSGVYTWEEVGGGGGATTIDSTDWESLWS